MGEYPAPDDRRDEELGREIVAIVGGRRAGKLRAQLAAALSLVKPAAAATEPPVVEAPAVAQVKRLKVTRKAAPVERPDLATLTPEQLLVYKRNRWQRTGTPFTGKRQQERARRQAERQALKAAPKWVENDGVPPVADSPEDAYVATTVRPPDLMACPRCNQYNQRTNYACRVCGFEFGFST